MGVLVMGGVNLGEFELNPRVGFKAREGGVELATWDFGD